MSITKIAAWLASGVLVGTNVFATPIVYSFSTGPQRFASGTGVGLLPADLVATGTFTYDPTAPFLQPGNGGAGRTYAGAISDFSLSIGSFSASDPFAFGFAANDFYNVSNGQGGFTPQFRDLLEFYMGPTGQGGWTSFDINGHSVARIRLSWLELPTGIPGDFLNDEFLPAELPNFDGGLALDIGPLLGEGSLAPSSGIVTFGDLRVARVPEPQTFILFLGGLLALSAVRSRRT